MTAQEQQALGFLLALTVLGTGVRVVRARADRVNPPASDSAALVRQLDAVDAAVAERGSRKKSRLSRGGAGREPAAAATEHLRPSADLLDITAVPQRRDDPGESVAPRRKGSDARAPARRIDLDVADQRELESLPLVGPSLAMRILENREACGPFGSLDALTRVRGIGSRTVERLSEYVTFSGRARDAASVPRNCR